MLYILCGIPFSGKSTLAKRLAEFVGGIRIDLDEIKFEIYGAKIVDANLKQSDWDIIYQEMYKRIREWLLLGKVVVHDTGNFTRYERGLVSKIAEGQKIEYVTIYMEIPKEVAYDRLKINRLKRTRFDVSDKDFESTVTEMEMPDPEENAIYFRHDEDIDKWLKRNITFKETP